MKLEKAIERNEPIIIKGELGDVLTAYPAIQLGIEALKWIAQWRGVNSSLANIRLPGETED